MQKCYSNVKIFHTRIEKGEKQVKISIRLATVDDASELLNIYSYYVENTAISFECAVPSVEEFQERIANTLKRFPYLVAICDGKIVGYAYVSPFKARAAYVHSVETSIYVDRNCRGKGVGRLLYEHLEKILKAQNILNMNAGAAYTETEDDHLTNDSLYFHEHMGYTKVAQLHKCGIKFNTWYDLIWMEKMLGSHDANPAEFIPFPDLKLERK
jgi:phosphinothricin acetyltransferase